ncbi:MAG TPA: alpha/beta hydrolase-fold protein [Ignavibacteriales bacterium]|nr:alpha/beta hydrolase-fold protein [Ignavibacteriales bacterium]
MNNITLLLSYLLENENINNNELSNINNLISTSNISFPITIDDKAIFIYEDENISSKTMQEIFIVGDFNQWQLTTKMQKLPNSNIYFQILTFEPDGRFDYRFVVNNQWILDPKNKLICHGGFGYNSELRMPKFVENKYFHYNANYVHGTIIYHELFSKILNKEYKIKVYTPNGYLKGKKLPILFIQDGFEYIDYAKCNNQLDNLINENLITHALAVFIKPNDRNNEYAYNETDLYIKFFVEELLEFINVNYSLPDETNDYHLLGADFGANISLKIALMYPDKFHNLYLHSPQLWPNNYEVLNLLDKADNKNLFIFSIYGKHEKNPNNDYNFIFEKLRKYSTNIKVEMYNQGHGWGLWKNTLHHLLKDALTVEKVTNPSHCKLSIDFDNESKHLQINLFLNSIYDIEVNIFNLMGKIILPIFNGKKEAGNHRIDVILNDLPANIYIVSLKVMNKTFIQKFNIS